MKPSYLTVIALIATLAAGYALIEYAESDREIWIAIGAWLLGFWFASGVNGVRSPEPESESELDDEGDYDYDDDDEEPDEDSEEDEWDDDDMNGRS